MEYSVVIRTLGKAGIKYQKLLTSLTTQTVLPNDIFVYIAEGYDMPKETIGVEKYIYVKKGMVAQRALPYDEVESEYILFLDDDVYLPSNAVEILYRELSEEKADVISPCVFFNHEACIKNKIRLSLLGKEVCRLWGKRWAYKVLRTGGFSYNNHPSKSVYESQTNAGPCFFCRKSDFLKIRLEDELWLDQTYYALPEDQVMFYKMYKQGLKVLTSFDSGIVHMDAGSALSASQDKEYKLICSEYRNKLIFWHRFLFLPEKYFISKILSVLSLCYVLFFQSIKYSILYMLGRKENAKAFKEGIKQGLKYIKSFSYKELPKIINKR